MMAVIDVIHPHMPGASAVNDHIEVTCVPVGRASIPQVTAPTLHPTMATALTLLEDGRMPEAILEALRLVEERVQILTASEDSGHTLMESVFGARPPQLDITTTTGPSAEDERESFRLLFIGAMLGLRDPHGTGEAVPLTVDETLEYLALASMLMRRLDRAEERLG
ncbi:MAG: TIGR02391 family protein [Pseudonocardiaceae bacterium]